MSGAARAIPNTLSEMLMQDRENFPPKSSVTFGEVYSAFDKGGNVASRRYGGVHVSKDLHIPNRWCTIRDNTLSLGRSSSRECLRHSSSSSSSSRPLPTSARSRSASPGAARYRPRSLPATPRGPGLPDFRTCNDFVDRFSDARCSSPGAGQPRNDPYGVVAGSAEQQLGRAAACPRCGSVYMADSLFCRHCGLKRGQTDTQRLMSEPTASSVGAKAASAMAGSYGGTGGSNAYHRVKNSASFAAEASKPQAPILRASCGWGAPESPPPLGGASSSGQPEADASKATVAAGSGNPRIASFLRLNGFLLRTHITSLISALAEDGWLQAWEKDRLCSVARNSDSLGAQKFLRTYMRFMETDDVPMFVAALKAQIA
eukprot:TRINITY_DN62909_c0_g1_i1.p1 TRINITY_DN62909_c0_g1~~TRINITY_DN62909_c0_g1_i1.p1  ORF type:complete len:385 (+),score=47.94 TRINITY_DN62909_c0_g1_i1:38-1156(+)